MTIILVNPPDLNVYPVAVKMPVNRAPVGLAYLSAALRGCGIESTLIDAPLNGFNIERTVEEAAGLNADAVGISCTTPVFPAASAVSQALKARGFRVFIGGPHVTAMPERALLESGADFACAGECESLAPFITNLLRNPGSDDFPGGIYVNRNGKIAGSGIAECPDLSTVPDPDPSLFDMQAYRDDAGGYGPCATVITGRGCVGRCRFCTGREQKLRYVPLKNVFRIIGGYYHEHGIRKVFFADDTLNASTDRLAAMMNGFAERGLEFNYACHIRLHNLDLRTIEILENSGCVMVRPGIESGSDEILSAMGKNITTGKILEKVRLLRSSGITIRATFMLGWPGETEDHLKKTIDFAEKVNADRSSFSIVTPLPGTDLWRTAERMFPDKMRSIDFSRLLFYNSVAVNMSNVSDDKLLHYQEYANRSLNKS